jgi:hypothetical protein
VTVKERVYVAGREPYERESHRWYGLLTRFP